MNVRGDTTMKRVHVSMPQNMIDMLDKIQRETGAPRAVIVRRAIEEVYSEEYKKFLEDSDSL